MTNQTFTNLRVSELLSRKVLGEITDEEMLELEQWRSVNAENQKFYQQFMQQAGLNKRLEQADALETEYHLNELMERIQIDGQSIRKMYSWQKYVAILAIPLMIGVVFYFKSKQKNPKESVVAVSKTPNGVILLTSEGKKINLDEVQKVDNGTIVSTSDDQELVYAKEGENATQMHTIVVPSQRDFKIVLSDGSIVWLNAGTTFTYPVEFSGKNREVTLDGEAFFEVKHNAQQPFLVKTNGVAVEDLGTSFNIKSYQKDSKVLTTLVSGKAKVVSTTDASQSAMLSPGYQSAYYVSSGQIDVKAVEINPVIAWKEGKFVFEHQRLEDIMNDISRWYGLEIDFANEGLKKLEFNGTISKSEPYDRIIQVLENTGKVKFRISQNKINVQ
ncbi:FecR family protein [Solitalea canadensis]|uniref:Fe2+-dicitrate sensor, membrane component n=1 Tax=Solitalea canadensis (strain ATCC 29591 / DSM 3403 / JCM 21819 / LMG 8368 / NBRC 15130 / NCIMB 12057 / USAM 9D) TaxID=929556 RepID=H8KUW2_SOLCM|nr:FecR domain-containing protein [Solitalea canadensis]AFD07662.1 Fe2+-dicitrate sensor, membrane component [Solitalea canadensis DSM 3403]